MAVSLALISNGCLACYTKRPVEIVVTDTNTSQPVANLPVKVEYFAMSVLFTPSSVEGVTNENGIVVLTLAEFKNGIMHLDIDEGKDRNGIEYSLNDKMIRDGAILNSPNRTFGQPEPAISIRLSPRRPSWFYRMFDDLFVSEEK
jgi:hypothetical protein